MAENGPIENLAKRIFNDIFQCFKWEQRGPWDQDFPCVNQEIHKPSDKTQDHKHPVDVVFYYNDPYLDRCIYLNTDLKSYKKESITSIAVENALISLSKTICCARNSEIWKDRYKTIDSDSEIRGLLFVFNHDNKLDHDFLDFFYPPKPKTGRRKRAVNIDNIDLEEGQVIHIIDPFLINYMMTVVNDLNGFISKKEFPIEDYGFFYPILLTHKSLSTQKYHPATIELIQSPYMIIRHGCVEEYDRNLEEYKEIYHEGYVIYYNEEGSTDEEFFYLLDSLSNYQILNGKDKIRIRFCHRNTNAKIMSNFNRGVDLFCIEYNLDDKFKKYIRNNVTPSQVGLMQSFFSSEILSWEVE